MYIVYCKVQLSGKKRKKVKNNFPAEKDYSNIGTIFLNRSNLMCFRLISTYFSNKNKHHSFISLSPAEVT